MSYKIIWKIFLQCVLLASINHLIYNIEIFLNVNSISNWLVTGSATLICIKVIKIILIVFMGGSCSKSEIDPDDQYSNSRGEKVNEAGLKDPHESQTSLVRLFTAVQVTVCKRFLENR